MNYCNIHGYYNSYYTVCPSCNSWANVQNYPYHQTYYTYPRGCICPPRSEETCKNPQCGRKNPLEQAQQNAVR